DRYDTISFKYWKEKFEPVKKFTSNHPYTGPAPMDLDTNRYQKLTDKDKDRLKKNQACFYCRQPGHMISACPMKKGKTLYTAQAEKHHDSEDQKGELNTFDEDKNSELLRLIGFIKNHSVNILIDGGASRNFIADRCVKKFGLKTLQEDGTGIVILADGSNQPCNLFIRNVPLKVGIYQDKVTFFVTKLNSYDIILGKPWLKKYNPRINWRTNEIQFTSEDKSIILQAGKKK